MKSFGLLLAIAACGLAQVPQSNAAGATMGHHHFIVADPAIHEKIWVDILGGEPSGSAQSRIVKFPGVSLVLSKGNATDGTEGSAIESIWFGVRNLTGLVDKLRAGGVKIIHDEGPILITEFPDKIEVHLSEDVSLNTPIAYWGLGIRATDTIAEREWWERVFGAETRVYFEYFSTTEIPGELLSFSKVDQAANTEGRAFDHTGVYVKNVDEYCARLARMGVTCERPSGTNTPIAMVTSPAGVRIEISQGLEQH